MLQQNDSKCYKKCFNRLGRTFILKSFYTEVLVLLEGLSTAISLLFGYCFDGCDRLAYPITLSERVVFLSV